MSQPILGNDKRVSFDVSVIQSLIPKSHTPSAKESEEDFMLSLPKGVERESVVISRVNQQFFRRMVLSSYEDRCCISGINNANLVEASHIVDWASNESERMNPCNGLCLSNTFHKAYDANLIGIKPDYTIVVSERMLSSTSQTDRSGKLYEYLEHINGKEIIRPNRFLPNKDLLELHYEAYREEN